MQMEENLIAHLGTQSRGYYGLHYGNAFDR
jgi:hypothetical protein